MDVRAGKVKAIAVRKNTYAFQGRFCSGTSFGLCLRRLGTCMTIMS